MTRVAYWPLDTDLSGWSGGGGWSIVNGWAQATGDAFGTPVIYRPTGLSTHIGYFEVDYYGTGGSNSWGSIAPGWNTAPNAYTDDGYLLTVHGPNDTTPGLMGVFGTGGYTLLTNATSPETAVRIGIEITGATTGKLYVNRVHVADLTYTNSHAANRNIALGAYNGLTAHFRRLAVYDAFPGTLWAETVVDDGPIGAWPLDEGGATAHAIVGPDGSYIGTPTTAAGPGTALPQGVVFDGSTQAAQISLPLSGVSDLTMSMWLWWDNYAPTPVGIAFEWPSPYDTGAATGVTFLPNANESTYNFAEASSSQYRGVKASPYPTSGAWHHFGIRYSAAAQTVTVLVDGAAPFTITGGLTGTVASTFAGGVLNLMSRGGTSFFGAGRMAGLAIFDRLLSDAELREHIAATGVAVSDAFDPRIPADPGGGFGDVGITPDPRIPADPGGGFGDVGITPDPRIPADPGGGFGAPPAKPYITNMSPRTGPTTTNPTITLTGLYFDGVTSVTFDGIPATILTAASTQITVALPDHPAGAGVVPVVVTADAGVSGSVGDYQFTYYVKCTVTGVSPATGAPAGNDLVTITGTGFTAGSTVKFGAAAATSVVVNSSTQITCRSPAGAADTTVDVVVTNVRESSPITPADQFTYLGLTPIVSALSPANDNIAGGAAVTITGVNFTGATAVHFGTVAAASFTVVNDTTITTTAPPGVSYGTVYVRVTTPIAQSQQVAAALFTYWRTCAVTSITPTSGSDVGGTTVLVNGQGFTGATAVLVDGVSVPFTVTVADAQLRISTPAHAAATVHIQVVGLHNTSAPVTADQFTYLANVPTVTSVTPNSGLLAGGGSVTIIGTNLGSVTAVKFGSTNATSFTVDSSTQITAVVPASATPQTVNVTVTNPVATSAQTVPYTWYRALTVTSVTPANGPVAGGTPISIVGTGFTGVLSVGVKIGGSYGSSLVVVSDTQITVNTPAHAAGLVDVQVTNPRDTQTLVGGYEYLAAFPTITSLTPPEGPIAGGTAVTIGGTGLTGADAVTVDGVAVPFTAVSDTQVTFTAPAHAIGVVNIRVSTPVGTSALGGAAVFRYYRPLTVTSVTPATGPDLGGTAVTIVGTGFTGVTAVEFGPGVFATLPGSFSDTQITVNTPPHAAGLVDVTVTNTREAVTIPGAFTYIGTVPTITSRTPIEGPVDGGTTVTLTGTRLTGTTGITVGGVPAPSFHVDSDTQVTFVTPPHAIGTVTVALTTPGGSATTSFLYYEALTVAALDPDTGPTTGGTLVTVVGTGFTGVTVAHFDLTPVSVNVLDDTTLRVTAPAHAPGAASVTFTNTRETSAPTPFTYTSPAPTITQLDPDHGLTTGGSVAILGSNLDTVTAVTVAGASVSFAVVDATKITIGVPAHTPGPVDIVVTNAAGTATATYTYYNPPTVTAVAPVAGTVDGGTIVTVTGTGFTGATAVDFDGTPGTSLHIASDTSLTVRTPAHAAGVVDVRVTTPFGTSPTAAADRFEFRVAPTVTAMSPTTGPATGGTTVTLTGTNLDTVTALTVDGTNRAFTIVDATTITVTTPAHAAGYVDVAVADSHGAASSPPTQFLFYAALAVTAVAPRVGSTGGGTTVVVVGTGFTDATAVDFGGAPGTGLHVESDTRLQVTAPAHALGTVDVQVATPRGTSPVTSADEFTYASPPSIETITPNSGTVAGGTPVTIAGSGFTGATDVRFDTLPASNVVVVDDSTISCVTPRVPSVGPRFVTVSTPAATSTEVVTYTFTNGLPVAVATATPDSGQAALTVQFTGLDSTDPDDDVPVSYLWDFGDGSTSNLPSPTYTYLLPGTYIATLTVTDSVGATATDSVEITVLEVPDNIPPTAIATATPHDGNARLRVQFIGSASYDLDGTIRRYHWDFGDGGTSESPDPSHIYQNAGVYNATLTVYDNQGGVDTSDPVTINVDQPPEILPAVITTIIPAKGPTAGRNAVRVKGRNMLNVDSVIFAKPGTEEGPSARIAVVVDDNSLTVIAPPGEAGFANVRCISGPFISATGAQTLYEYVPPPVAVGTATVPEGACGSGVAVEFSSAGSYSPYGPLTYSWTFGTGTILDFGDNDASQDPNPTHVYLGSGGYTARLTVTDSRGISATVTVPVSIPACDGGSGGGGQSGSGGGGHGGGGGGGPVDHHPGEPGDPVPPTFIDSTCVGNQAHIIRPHQINDGASSDPTVGLMLESWTMQRLLSGILFTVEVGVTQDYKPPPVSSKYHNVFPARIYLGAFSMTADAIWPGGAPSATTENEGYGRSARILGGSGATLTPGYVGGVFAPLINDGTTGIEAGMTFRLSILAPPELEIAFAQVGWLAPNGYGVGDLGMAWVNVDCTIDEIVVPTGWTVGDPTIFGGGSWVVSQGPIDIDSHPRRHR
jgi:PKD repeat protein